ncbi:MAG: helix-hairpin-helix domain-containing protein [Lacipirellulaceae bacterium]
MSQLDTPPSQKPPLLNARDQASVWVLTLAGLLLLVCYWFYRGGHRGELIQIDRAEPLEAEFLVDINQAEWPELSQLPGVGKKLGERIVEYREAHGDFQSLDEIKAVNGIGPRTLENIRPFLIPIPGEQQMVGEPNRFGAEVN